jgi:mannose-1-phosphate guanylyltransferase
MAEIFAEGSRLYNTRKEKKFVQSAYAQCRNISVDYAIMEKSDNVFMVMGDFDWSDLGSWGAVYDIRGKDENGNILRGDIMAYESTGNFVFVDKNKLAIIEDLHDHLVADFEDVLVICRKDDSARFREYVKEVKKRRGETLL